MHKSTRQAMGHGWTLQRRCALCAQLTMLAVAVLCADDAPRQSAPAHAVTSAASADTVAPCPAGKFLRLHPEPAMCAHCPIGRTSQPGARHCQKQHCNAQQRRHHRKRDLRFGASAFTYETREGAGISVWRLGRVPRLSDITAALESIHHTSHSEVQFYTGGTQ